ncbi:MAG: lipid-binding SYLF domain-containing protein [Thiohalocapsa sp.]|nr:lipid-binding SYLF domain-containing protein [Thiohalocapsa sp.]
MKRRITALLAVISLSFLGSAPVLAQDAGYGGDDPVARAEELGNAQETVLEAAAVVEQMGADADARQLLDQADAVFIVPDYARASLIVGGAGGQGILIARTDDGWSAPAFYNIGAINLGAAAGVEGGSIAFLLMSDDALDGFENQHNFSLNADAGLTIIDWTERAQVSAGKGADVVVWSDTEGLYGDLAISVSDIFWDEQANAAYYGRVVTPVTIIVGTISDPMSESELRSEFSALETADNEDQSQQGKTDEPAKQNGQ